MERKKFPNMILFFVYILIKYIPCRYKFSRKTMAKNGRTTMIRLMKSEDYQDVYNLWDEAEEVCINPKDDTYEKIQEFLLKNPEWSE